MLFIIFIAVIIATIFGLILNYKFLILLKEKHAKKWEELGSPTFFINNSIRDCSEKTYKQLINKGKHTIF